MNQYKMFIATYAYTIKSLSNSQVAFQVVKMHIGPEANDAVLYEYESTHATVEEAKEAVEAVESKGTVSEDIRRIVQVPKVITSTYSYTSEFDSELAAHRWLDANCAEREGGTYSKDVTEVTFDEDDIANYEFKSTYTATAYVNVVKRITIDVDPSESEWDGVEDAYGAEEAVREKINGDEFEYEIEAADVWDTEINDITVEED